MTALPETFESLWEHCTANNRAVPRDWHRLYEMLKDKQQNSAGGWEPSLPLILAAWHVTMPIEKQLRFKEHIRWAADLELPHFGGRVMTTRRWVPSRSGVRTRLG